ncbi:radical SAM protein [Rhodanobacter sp. Soil772]|uniref:radical SAM protein n=1 Tax=Rhodanobacter sp. Soil772 TaxID=1736406 RepID=UPI0009EA4303|nr:radical SAM protein [Rhodanobacter sp. Soil772]
MKTRLGPDGLHIFDRRTGLNVLFNEVQVEESKWSSAPRQVSLALTNLCDLHCAYCYAPKHRAMLSADAIADWLIEIDQAGSLGVGFGGGEPTLHAQFAEICSHAAKKTKLAVTLTTHGHRLRAPLLDKLNGNVHFIRVSVDGVRETYENNRGRPYASLLARLRDARAQAQLGINIVINDQTVDELDELSELAHEIDASEILLLPQRATSSVGAASDAVGRKMSHWVAGYNGRVRLAISEESSGGLMTCDPLPLEKALRSYVHVTASGVVKVNSYATDGVNIGAEGLLAAIHQLGEMSRGVH